MSDEQDGKPVDPAAPPAAPDTPEKAPELPAATPAPAEPSPVAPVVPADPASPATPAVSAAPAAPASDDAAKAAAKAEAIAKAKAAAEAKKAAAAAAGGGAAPAPAAAKPAPAHEDPNKPAWEKDPTVPEWQDAASDPLAAALKEELGDAIESARTFAGDLTFQVRRDAVAQVSASLKTKHGYTYLVDVCGSDFPKREPRFDVVYHLYSFEANRRVRLKVMTDEATPVPTVSGIWRAANWPEREVYDMFGVRFDGHPDMTRILLWEGFNGFPLRKDFPIEGIDTGSAIYPEYYETSAGPVTGTGTGWKPPKPPAPPAPPAAAAAPAAEKPAGEQPS